MNRQQATNAYRRTKDWAHRQSMQLREEILVPVFSGNMCVMHNAVIAAKQGRPWAELPKNYVALARYYDWKQRQIWRESERLGKAFARYF